MNFRTTLILIVLLALVGLYVVYDRVATPPAQIPDPRARRFYEGAASSNVMGLTIEPAKGEAIKLTRVPTGEWNGIPRSDWLMSAPFQGRVDAGPVNTVVDKLTSIPETDEPGGDMTLSFAPVVTVKLDLVGGKQVKLSVGAPNAVGQSVVRTDDGGSVQWHLAPSDMSELLAKSADTYRDPRLVSMRVSEFLRVSLQANGKTLTLTRNPRGWSLDDGNNDAAPVQADLRALPDVLSALANARATEVIRTLPEDALVRPQLVVHYSGAIATTQPSGPTVEGELVFGRFEDARHEQVLVLSKPSNTTAKVPAETLTRLKKSLLDLRDKQVWDIDPEQVSRLEITRGGQSTAAPATSPSETIVFDRPVSAATTAPTPAVWRSNGAAVDGKKIEAVLNALHPLTATKFIEGSTASTQPSTPITLRVTVAGTMHELLLGETGGRADGLVFELSPALYDAAKAAFARSPLSSPFIEPPSPPNPPDATQPNRRP